MESDCRYVLRPDISEADCIKFRSRLHMHWNVVLSITTCERSPLCVVSKTKVRGAWTKPVA